MQSVIFWPLVHITSKNCIFKSSLLCLSNARKSCITNEMETGSSFASKEQNRTTEILSFKTGGGGGGKKSFMKYFSIVNLYPLPSKYRFPLQNLTIPLKHLQFFLLPTSNQCETYPVRRNPCYFGLLTDRTIMYWRNFVTIKVHKVTRREMETTDRFSC